jgi:hypothetical protein
MAKKPKTVVEGVTRDLAALPGDLASSGLALSALQLAREMDGDAPTAAKAAAGRALARALKELRELKPAATNDVFDALAERRRAKLAEAAS